MSNIIDEDFLACQVCLEQFYSNENQGPICLECGHTFCKRCILQITRENQVECPIDKKLITIPSEKVFGVENLIIKKTIALIDCVRINVKSFPRLSLYYCLKCNLFISNYVKNIHNSVNHNIISISTYTFKWFDYISNNIDTKTITPIVKMYIIAYFYQSPYIIKEKQFNIKEMINFNNKMFTFYGEKYHKTDKNNKHYKILMSVLSDNNDKYNDFTIMKGIIIGVNLQIMHGYFLFNWKEPYTAVRGFGVLNYIDSNFFGIVTLFPKANHSGFAFDYGILKESNTFFMGTFNHNNFEYPIYNFISGEEITLSLQGIHVIRKPYLNDLSEETFEPFDEVFEYNMFYKCVKDTICIETAVTKVPNCRIKYSFKDPKCFYKGLTGISIVIEKDKKKEIKVSANSISFNGNEELLSLITFRPLHNNNNNSTEKELAYLDQKIEDFLIKLKSQTIDTYILFVKEPLNDNKNDNDNENEISNVTHIIITNEVITDQPFCGYDIFINNNESTTCLGKIANFQVNSLLKDNPALIKELNSLLDIQLSHCQIKYQLFTPLKYIIDKKALSFDFNMTEETITCNYVEVFKKNTVHIIENLKEMTIKHLLPNIYYTESFNGVSAKFTAIDRRMSLTSKNSKKKVSSVDCNHCSIY